MKTTSSRAAGTPVRRSKKPSTGATKPKPANAALAKPVTKRKPLASFKYEVCTSFAGEDRAFVERVVSSLKRRKIKCFYDFDEQATLLGKDLFTYLDKVYREDARFCIMFISKHYPVKQWTNHERKSIQARVFESEDDYLIPVRLDDTEVPGVRPTLGYVDGRRHDPSQIAALIQTKVRGKTIPKKPKKKPEKAAVGRRVNWTHMTSLRKLKKALNDPVAIALLDLTAKRAGQIVSFADVLKHAGVVEPRQGMIGLGLLTKTIKREFNLPAEKVVWPVERLFNVDGDGQTSYCMLPEVAQAWLQSAT